MDKSMTHQLHNPEALFDPSPYGFSHVAVVPANSQLIFVAGQGGEEDINGTLSDDFRTQVQHAFNNIRIALHSQNAALSSVVKVTTLVVDHNEEKLQIIIEEFTKAWPDKKFPTNTLIPVPRLALARMQVEIEAYALL
jgi:enamine deaminase RidA (YjgF/YER057c/UK114 family)